jgi:hypothetical protein
MPNQRPLKPRAKAIDRAEISVDWLALWAISLGVCAMVLAGTAFLVAFDRTGAVLTLVGSAAVISLILKASARGST